MSTQGIQFAKAKVVEAKVVGGPVPGIGAWSFGRYHYNMDVPNSRVAAGIFAFKQELIYLGYGEGIKVDLPIFGSNMRDQTLAFQKDSGGLDVDGQIGSKTARHMFFTRGNRFQNAHAIPGKLVVRQITLESANDPVAQGYADDGDEGLGQIHLSYHPEITVEQAWDPSFAIPWLGGQLVGATAYCDNDFDGGVAAYNIGWTYARQWVRDGKPASGGPLLGTVDSYARATKYVALVKQQPLY